ncbi:hypothetical protein [Sediminibacterium sp. TEGAF015]|uniref:hypothetical protein n=1 Tax=Sediminibacterium sp. TEGAF015 TaxID=575378 RepID=UPI00220474F7|nr:hypothetical protein [Sediminibacterium sp. TEGAF015]BDQ13302.1 hypothetical protein TEGAF0_25190 [Sediminibacterium sp. TEGAF015]
MKKLTQIFIAGALALTATSCVKVNFEDPIANTGTGANADDPNTTRILKGSYERSITLTGGTYTIQGYVYFQQGATLTIPAGTILKSDISQKGALIIERGAKIEANGTASNPIVFTSGKAAGSRLRGDWGGVILLGNAPTNRPLSPAPLIEGGVDRRYGGTTANDNSGTMRYVRIEFAGIAAEPGSEINGLTLGGVGSGTTLEYIQVSYGNDDAYEFFGGTVNAKNLVSYATSDDDYDFDFGFSGKIQFAVAHRRPEIGDTDAGNGVESDNDGSGTAALPYTRPQLSNFTWIGSNGAPNTQANENFGNRWRRATRFSVRNSIIMGWPKAGFSMESAATGAAFNTDTSEFKNNLVHALLDPYKVDAAAGGVITAAQVKTKAEANGGITYANAADIMLTAPFNVDAPNYLPMTGSPALTGASFTGADAFFTAVAYRGAFGTTNWLTGWASFTPQTNVY